MKPIRMACASPVLVAELVAELVAIALVATALVAAGAQAKVVAPRLGSLKGQKGAAVNIDFSLLTAGSVLFDAVYIPGGEESVAILKGDAKALLFVKEAYLHCKTIAATGEGIDLLRAAHLASDKTAVPYTKGVPKNEEEYLVPDEGVITGTGPSSRIASKFIKSISLHRHFDREMKGQMPA